MFFTLKEDKPKKFRPKITILQQMKTCTLYRIDDSYIQFGFSDNQRVVRRKRLK